VNEDAWEQGQRVQHHRNLGVAREQQHDPLQMAVNPAFDQQQEH
jgi:hypothetical protein